MIMEILVTLVSNMLSKGKEPKTYCVLFLFDTCYCTETLIIPKKKTNLKL